MKAKMAILQKMYRNNLWGNVKQRLKEFFDRFVGNGTREIVLDQHRAVYGLNGWSFRMDSPEPFERQIAGYPFDNGKSMYKTL